MQGEVAIKLQLEKQVVRLQENLNVEAKAVADLREELKKEKQGQQQIKWGLQEEISKLKNSLNTRMSENVLERAGWESEREGLLMQLDAQQRLVDEAKESVSWLESEVLEVSAGVSSAKKSVINRAMGALVRQHGEAKAHLHTHTARKQEVIVLHQEKNLLLSDVKHLQGIVARDRNRAEQAQQGCAEAEKEAATSLKLLTQERATWDEGHKELTMACSNLRSDVASLQSALRAREEQHKVELVHCELRLKALQREREMSEAELKLEIADGQQRLDLMQRQKALLEKGPAQEREKVMREVAMIRLRAQDSQNEMQSKIHQIEEQLVEARGDALRVANKHELLTNKHEKLVNEHADCPITIKALQDAAQQLQAERQKETEQRKKEVHSFSIKLDSAATALQALKNSRQTIISQLVSKCETLEADLDAINAEAAAQENQAAVIQTVRSQPSTQRSAPPPPPPPPPPREDEDARNTAALERANIELQAQVSQLQAKLVDGAEVLVNLRQELNKARTAIKSLESEMESKRRQSNRVAEHAGAATTTEKEGTLKETEEASKTQIEAKKRTKKQRQDTSREVPALEKRIENLQATCEHLKAELDAVTSETAASGSREVFELRQVGV